MLCCLALMSLVAGCGDDESDPAKTSAASTTDTTASRRPALRGIKNRFDRPKSPGPHPGAKVDSLIVKDVVKGDGDTLAAGDTAIVEFILSDWHTGKEIDASWGKKKAYETQIEHNVVIEGWVQGLARDERRRPAHDRRPAEPRASSTTRTRRSPTRRPTST